jgi:PAS domain S-box-containing protein
MIETESVVGRGRFQVRRLRVGAPAGALRRSEGWFKALVEGSLQGILVHRGGRPLFANDTFARMYGWHGKDEVTALASVETLLAPGRSLGAGAPADERGSAVLEYEGRRRDGSPIWLRTITRAVDWAGGPAELVIQVDISEQRRIERALAVSEHEVSSYFDAPVAGIGVLTVDGRVMRCNEMLGRLMGCAPDRLLGRSFRDVTAPEFLPASEAAYRRLLSGEVERLTFEKEYLRADGTRFAGEVTLACVRDHQGRPGYVVAMIQDVSRRKAVESELRLAKEAADRANASKTRFLAAASHDLRQPLMALAMFISALDASNRDPDLAVVIRKIKSSSEEVTALLNALLDISRLDAGLVTPAPVVFVLAPLVEALEREFAPLAHAAGLSFRAVSSSVAVDTDPVLLAAMLRNLLSNAIRYTERGGIVLGCRRCGDHVRIEVWDTGIGIAEAELESIFQEFHQVHNGGRDRAAGMGLGLAMVSRMARLLGLRVAVRSVPERGSVFSVAVTCTAGEPANRDIPQSMVAVSGQGALIAVVDDEEIVRDSLGTVLGCWGYRVISGASERELLEALAELGEVPDLVIADLRLGTGRDGIELITFLQRELDTPFPAVLLTGDTAPERLRQARASGLPVLHKPVNGRELKEAVARLLGRQAGGSEPGTRPWKPAAEAL